MELTKPHARSVPLHAVLLPIRIDPSFSLGHVAKLASLIDESGSHPYSVCMGPISGARRHCWLEAGEIVADLTWPFSQQFFQRDEYYSAMQIEPSKVRRYTRDEVPANFISSIRNAVSVDTDEMIDSSSND